MIKLVGHKSTRKTELWKIFIYGMVEFFCYSLYVIFSGIGGTFNWTVDGLTSTPAGMVIQTVNLISIIAGFILAVHIVIYVLLLFAGSDADSEE